MGERGRRESAEPLAWTWVYLLSARCTGVISVFTAWIRLGKKISGAPAGLMNRLYCISCIEPIWHMAKKQQHTLTHTCTWIPEGPSGGGSQAGRQTHAHKHTRTCAHTQTHANLHLFWPDDCRQEHERRHRNETGREFALPDLPNQSLIKVL